MNVTLTDRAQAVCALEAERIALFESVADIELRQQLALREFQKTMRAQSGRHTEVINKLIALEKTIEALL